MSDIKIVDNNITMADDNTFYFINDNNTSSFGISKLSETNEGPDICTETEWKEFCKELSLDNYGKSSETETYINWK